MPRHRPNQHRRESTPRATPPGDRIYTRAELREVDRLAEAKYAIPTILLMEHASIALFDAARRLMRSRRADHVVIVCGPGNNGGDGLALARHLHNAGLPLRVLLAAPRTTSRGDAAANLRIAERMGLDITEAAPGAPHDSLSGLVSPAPARTLLVDALFGTGLDRPVTGAGLTLIRSMNDSAASGSPVLAVDIPSGLDADTGRPLGAAVRADLTVSFVGFKTGFLALEAQPFLGEVVVAGIGAPRELVESLGKPAPAIAAPGSAAASRKRPPRSAGPGARSRRRGH